MEIPKSLDHLINVPIEKEAFPDYLQLLCPAVEEAVVEMETAIKNSGFNIRPGYPKTHHNSLGKLVFLAYEIDVIFDIKDNKQNYLKNLQDKLMGFKMVAQTGD